MNYEREDSQYTSSPRVLTRENHRDADVNDRLMEKRRGKLKRESILPFYQHNVHAKMMFSALLSRRDDVNSRKTPIWSDAFNGSDTITEMSYEVPEILAPPATKRRRLVPTTLSSLESELVRLRSDNSPFSTASAAQASLAVAAADLPPLPLPSASEPELSPVMPPSSSSSSSSATSCFDEIWSAGLTPGRMKRPRVYHQARFWCNRCQSPVVTALKQKCPQCRFTLYDVCPFCDRGYSRGTMEAHLELCCNRYAAQIARFPPPPCWAWDPYELADLRGLVDFMGTDSSSPPPLPFSFFSMSSSSSSSAATKENAPALAANQTF